MQLKYYVLRMYKCGVIILAFILGVLSTRCHYSSKILQENVNGQYKCQLVAYRELPTLNYSIAVEIFKNNKKIDFFKVGWGIDVFEDVQSIDTSIDIHQKNVVIKFEKKNQYIKSIDYKME